MKFTFLIGPHNLSTGAESVVKKAGLVCAVVALGTLSSLSASAREVLLNCRLCAG